MAISYKPLLHLLVDKQMVLNDLRFLADVNSSTLTRIRRNDYISLQTIDRICTSLNCNVEEVVEIIHNKEENK